jgi:hypothetical protein
MMMNEEKIEMRINDAPRLSPIVKAKTHFSFHDFPPFEFFLRTSYTFMDENKCYISLRTTRISIDF